MVLEVLQIVAQVLLLILVLLLAQDLAILLPSALITLV
jgi:hypothetical protein